MTQRAYRNLSEFELEMADHYAETGNREGLRRMEAISQGRGTVLERTVIRVPAYSEDYDE